MRPAELATCGRQLLWLRRTRHWSAERIEAYQSRALRAMLRHAATTVPYYRSLGIDLAGLDRPDALSAFPLLTRAEIQRNGERLVSERYDRTHLHVSHSSGSTGRPVSTWFDRDAWLLTKHALKLRRTLSDLRRPPYRVLIVGEESAVSRMPTRSICGVARVSIHGSAEEHLEVVERFRPSGIYGAPSWLLELSRAADRRRLSLPRPRVIWTSSEVLTPAVRAEIERGFGCPVRDVYGSTELKEVAVECPHGHRHVNFESSYVESLSSADEERGALVITSLVNRAMPLIRYRIGDLGRLVEGRCACGSAAPWIADIAGREVDLIELPGGHRISPYLLSTIIETYPDVACYQLYLSEPDHVEVRYRLRSESRTLDTDALARELGRAAAGLRFSFRRAAEIEPTPAGKRLPLIRAAD